MRIASSRDNFAKNVFINCPFDKEYLSLLRPLLFTILRLGYNPRIASERFDSLEQRIQKVCSLIQVSRFSIHDISRMRSKKRSEFYRLNLPLELGIDYGCRLFKRGEARSKLCLILEKERYAYLKALSDLAGVDIKSHGNEPEELVRQVRNWFVENELATADSPAKIWEHFNEFMADFHQKRQEEGFSDRDLEGMPVAEYISFVTTWLSTDVLSS